MSLARVTGNYQVAIPLKLRRKFKIKLGDVLEVVETEEGILYKPKGAIDEIKEYWRKRVKEEGEVELSEETWEKVERSIKQIEKGCAKTFNNAEELIQDLRKK